MMDRDGANATEHSGKLVGRKDISDYSGWGIPAFIAAVVVIAGVLVFSAVDPERTRTAAYHNLNQLATETIPFLESRRCRQFLANIAPQLLQTVAETPDPDMALVNLEKVSASLGGKATLWELFSFNTPSLKLYVELCAWSQFLS